jgi:subfamily B ATP-binding cassette protein MsbA
MIPDLAPVLQFSAPYLRRYRTRFILGIALGVLFGISNGAFVWATKVILERMGAEAATVHTAAGRWTVWAAHVQAVIDPWLPQLHRALDLKQIVGGLLFLPVLVGLRGALGYLSSYCMNWAGNHLINDVRADVLNKLQSLSLDYFQRSSTGDLITRVNGDTTALHRALSLGLSDLIKEPVTLVSLFVGLLLLDWKLTLLAAVFIPLCVVPVVIFGRKIRHATEQITGASIAQSSLLVEALANIRLVQAFGLETTQAEEFRQYAKRLVHHFMRGMRAKELVNPVVETVWMIGVGAVIVFIIGTGRSFADLGSFVVGLILFSAPIKRLAGLSAVFQESSYGVERLRQLFAEQPTVQEKAGAVVLPLFHQSIRFEQVKAAYGEKPALRGISLEVPRGSKLGLAGESGSGKSTLVNLLFRFYDVTEGRILVDGLDLREVKLDSLRAQLALVSQEVLLFNKSVAENIAHGKLGASPAEIEVAAKQAFAHEFIQRLPQGYDTVIGERGSSLSGGERQRLAIARAFIRNAPILVLDEATASLDAQAEQEVQRAIDRLAENRTVICIAHRLSTLAGMDQILVLRQGEIVEQGTFADLVQQNGVFAAMAKNQGIR